MDIVPSEKGGGGFGISRSAKDLSTSTSDFEKELFKDGVYEFNSDKEIRKSEAGYINYRDWLRHPLWVSRTKDVLANFVESKNWELAWKHAFSGKIPKSWHIWHGPLHDFEEAEKRRVQLGPTLINAGVSHDHHLVVNRVGKAQKLNPQQLGIVLGRDDIPQWNSDEVIAAQRQKGMTSEEYSQARDYATEVRETIRRVRVKSKRENLTPPKPQLRDRNRGGGI